MNTYRAIITDLDGTAVDAPTERLASPRLAKIIDTLHNKDIKVCAATGRSISFAQPMFESMELKDPAIVSGGSLIVDPVSHEELWSCNIERDSMNHILSILDSHSFVNYFWNNYDEDTYWTGGWTLDKLNREENVYFFGILSVPENEVENLMQQLQAVKDISAVVVTGQFENAREFHITHSAATKEHAVYELERLVGVKKEEAIGIGDGHNDIHLFRAVGYKVAMGNAAPELKELADRVIGSVKEDGLAAYLEELDLALANDE